MVFTFDINWLAVVVAAALNMVVGALWYSPALFSKPWLAAMGLREEEIGNPGPGYAIATLASLVIAVVLSSFIHLVNAAGPINGALLGLIAAFGFAVTTGGTTAVFSGTSRTLSFINLGYNVVAFGLMGALLGTWW